MKALRYGASGADVLMLQLALKRSGRYPFGLDGVYGTRTLNAVRRFQTAEGLKPDGIAGERTNAALEAYLLGCRRVRVKAGDTFYRLAKRHGVDTALLIAANPEADPENLKTGSEVTVPLAFNVVTGDIPFTSRLCGYAAEGLMLRYPFIEKTVIGSSELGSPLTALKIGGGPKRVFFNAAHHANEWITAPLVLSFAEEYARAFAAGGAVGGAEAGGLYSAASLYVLPLVDPDGADLVNGAIDRDSSAYAQAVEIAGNYPDIPFPKGWKANILGTDINLNYPAEWERAKQIKARLGFASPAPRDWPGEAPLSCAEARAVHDFTEANDFALTVSFHTQGEEIYWSFNGIEPERGREIGEKMARASGYALADPPEASSYAGYKDWFIQTYRRPGYTVEAGRGENPLPLNDLDEMKAACFPLMAEAIANA